MKEKNRFLLLLLAFCVLRTSVLLFEPVIARSGFAEAFRATAAFDLITERNFSLFDYTYHHNEGGSLIAVLLTAAVFKITGISLFSLHLVALLFNLLAFIIGFFLMRRFIGEKQAHIFALLFVFAPQSYVKLSLTNWGSFLESINFTFLIAYGVAALYTYRSRLSQTRTVFYVCALGLVCGFSIWFSYFNLIAVAACIVCFFIWKRIFLGFKQALCFSISFVVGISPLIFYAATYAQGGAGVIHYKPLYRHLGGADVVSTFGKLLSLVLFDFPMSLAHKNFLMVSHVAIAYVTYFVFIFSFLSVIFLLRKGRKTSYFRVSIVDMNPVIVFIVVYALFFIFAFVISDFSVERQNVCNGYRYLTAIVPVAWMLFSVLIVYLSERSRWYLSLLYSIVFINFLGVLPLVDHRSFLDSLKTSPLSYKSLGMSVASKFAGDLDECLRFADKLKPAERVSFFWGLGEELGRRSVIQGRRLNPDLAKVPQRYRVPFYLAMGAGIYKSAYQPELAFRAFGLIDKRYVGYGYAGLGGYLITQEPHRLKEIASSISSYGDLCFFYQGVGAGVFHLEKLDIKKCNDALLTNPDIGQDVLRCCFQGISLVLLDEDVRDWQSTYMRLRDSCNVIDEQYRKSFLQGLEQNGIILRESFSG